MPNETVLIIDDEESVRNSLAGVMRDEGYEVVTAASGKEGHRSASRRRSRRIALLDIAMPEMDGIETLRRLKELRPDMPVVMITGHGTIETAVKTTKMGAYDFIVKPPELQHLDARGEARDRGIAAARGERVAQEEHRAALRDRGRERARSGRSSSRSRWPAPRTAGC